MATKLSLTNLIASAPTVTASSAATAYPAVNVRTPERPFMPWKTTVTTDASVVVDFGTATTVDLVGVVAINASSVRIQGHASDSWTSPSYDEAVTIARNPWTSRYQHAHVVTGTFSYRYLRLFIPSQTPTDAAAAFSLGGLWAGRITALPRSLAADYSVVPNEPGLNLSPQSGAWNSHVVLGEPWANVTGHLTLPLGQPAALSDTLALWLEVLRQMRKSDPVLLALEGSGDPAQCFVLRRMNDPQWRINKVTAEADLEWREAT